MSEWKGKKSEPGFMGLNDSPDSKTKKSNKSLNQKNHNLSRLVGSSDSEWKEYKVGDVAEVVNGYAFKSEDYSKCGIPIIN
ncbi:MAG: hypothetical protein KJ666_17135 [Bacteroidetes bacterium]|nr:hypothetical protein [Bacteroidota bacterium]MBU2585387.1 hypothetical protein [Bacteroidota bacterium]